VIQSSGNRTNSLCTCQGADTKEETTIGVETGTARTAGHHPWPRKAPWSGRGDRGDEASAREGDGERYAAAAGARAEGRGGADARPEEEEAGSTGCIRRGSWRRVPVGLMAARSRGDGRWRRWSQRWPEALRVALEEGDTGGRGDVLSEVDAAAGGGAERMGKGRGRRS
jgi:hypothetical protein